MHNYNDKGSPSYGACQVKETAMRQVLKMHRQNPCKDTNLLKKEVNTCFAAHYVKYQLTRYDNNYLAAIGAYNAGRAGKRNFTYMNKVLLSKKLFK